MEVYHTKTGDGEICAICDATARFSYNESIYQSFQASEKQGSCTGAAHVAMKTSASPHWD